MLMKEEEAFRQELFYAEEDQMIQEFHNPYFDFHYYYEDFGLTSLKKNYFFFLPYLFFKISEKLEQEEGYGTLF